MYLETDDSLQFFHQPRSYFLALVPFNLDFYAGVRVVVLIVFLSVLLGGAFSVYYGDEKGMTGGEDPLNRGAMNWCVQDGDMLRFYSDMIQLKRERLRGASLRSMELSDGVLKLMFSGEKTYIAFITAPGGKSPADLPEGKNLLSGTVETVNGVTYICSFALFG